MEKDICLYEKIYSKWKLDISYHSQSSYLNLSPFP